MNLFLRMRGYRDAAELIHTTVIDYVFEAPVVKSLILHYTLQISFRCQFEYKA